MTRLLEKTPRARSSIYVTYTTQRDQPPGTQDKEKKKQEELISVW